MKPSMQPIIIKKKKGHGHAHHGGAWKVAYADFVTAMMAFFLLMWLINVTSPEQKTGIAEYFNPTTVSQRTAGSGGVLDGASISAPGPLSSPTAEITVDTPMPFAPRARCAKGFPRARSSPRSGSNEFSAVSRHRCSRSEP